jgi:hypothetical protein
VWGRQGIELPVLRIPRKFQTAANRPGLTWRPATFVFHVEHDARFFRLPGAASRRRSRRSLKSSNIADSINRCDLPGRRVFHVEHATRDSSHLPPDVPRGTSTEVGRNRGFRRHVSRGTTRLRHLAEFTVPHGTLDEPENAALTLRRNIDSPAFESSNSRPNDMITTVAQTRDSRSLFHVEQHDTL